MYHFRTNPPARQIKPASIYAPSVRPAIVARLDQYRRLNPSITEEMIGRLFADDPDMIDDLRRGGDLPERRRLRIEAMLDREGC